jgi:hypothetical protein
MLMAWMPPPGGINRAMSQLSAVLTIPILAASNFWPDWALHTASPSPCRAWHQRKCRPLSSHFTNA